MGELLLLQEMCPWEMAVNRQVLLLIYSLSVLGEGCDAWSPPWAR